jgi:hypothetical protein
MDVDSLRLPPELWDKIVWYLICNDGFVSNLGLLHLLYQIPDAIYGLERHMGYWPEFEDVDADLIHCHYKTPIKTLKFMHKYRPNKYGVCIELNIYIHKDFIYIEEDEREGLRRGEWDGYDEMEDFSRLYGSLDTLPHGIRITLESIEHPWCLRIVYPSRNENGELYMRSAHVDKHVVECDETTGRLYVSYTLIDLRHIHSEGGIPESRCGHWEDDGEYGVIRQFQEMYGDKIADRVFRSVSHF